MNLQITAQELAEKLRLDNPPHLLDVREVEENQFAALPNSTLIPLGELAMRVEEIEDPLMRELRYLDKLVDELAKGKAMEKILRA